jgi:hypothetical protein
VGHSEWSYSSHWWNKKPPGTIRAITATGPFISFITDVDQKSRCHGAHTNPEMLITHPYFQTATKQAGSSKILSEAVGLTLTNSPSRLGSFIKCNFIISLGTSHPLAVRIPYHPFIICFLDFLNCIATTCNYSLCAFHWLWIKIKKMFVWSRSKLLDR